MTTYLSVAVDLIRGYSAGKRSSRVQLSFNWLTSAAKCSNFGGNVNCTRRRLPFVSVHRKQAGYETSLQCVT